MSKRKHSFGLRRRTFLRRRRSGPLCPYDLGRSGTFRLDPVSILLFVALVILAGLQVAQAAAPAQPTEVATPAPSAETAQPMATTSAAPAATPAQPTQTPAKSSEADQPAQSTQPAASPSPGTRTQNVTINFRHPDLVEFGLSPIFRKRGVNRCLEKQFLFLLVLGKYGGRLRHERGCSSGANER